MKKILLLVLLLCYLYPARTQSSQIKLYLQQIAANQSLIGYLRKGYTIARKGLAAISDIKRGEFDLHRNYFGSLASINPVIRRSVYVADIISLQLKIVRNYKNEFAQLKKSGQFSKQELDYIYSLLAHLLEDTSFTMEDLYALLTTGQYKLTDDERIKRLHTLYLDMQGKYVFVRRFGNEALLLAVQRRQEKQSVDNSRSLFDIKP